MRETLIHPIRIPLNHNDASNPRKKIAIRKPTASDVAALAELLSEMQRHYGFPVLDEQALEAALLACKPVSAAFDPRVIIAGMDNVVVGSIILNVTFPAHELSRSLYIRDLYVAKALRRHGIGRALVQAAARQTFAEGFSALDWTTDADNMAARTMYEACGAQGLRRTYFRLTPGDISNEFHTGLLLPAESGC